MCDSIESCLPIHRSAASFLSQYTGIIQEHAPKKTKYQKHKTSSVVVIDGNQEIGKPASPPSLKLPGGDLTKPRAGSAGLPLNISFLLKPNFRHSCIPLFKRKNVQAAVILPIHLRTPIQILVECNRLRCNSMWVLSARAARECINGK